MWKSWKLGRLLGIDLALHWSFLLVPLWALLSSLAAGEAAATAIGTVIFVLIIFGCVLLHELGHALMARHFGIPTRRITLLPIGGLAQLERIPKKPMEELAVALAGPAVNVVIASSLIAGTLLSGGDPPGSVDSLITGPLVDRLVWVNVVLAVFNLVPAFPMDGGRVFRALLACVTTRVRATHIAAAVGQLLAIGFALLGLIANPMLIAIAIYIFVAARAEATFVAHEAFWEATGIRVPPGPGLRRDPPDPSVEPKAVPGWDRAWQADSQA